MSAIVTRQMTWDEETGSIKEVVVVDNENYCNHVFDVPKSIDDKPLSDYAFRQWTDRVMQNLDGQIESNRRWRGIVAYMRQERFDMIASARDRNKRHEELMAFHTAQKEQERQSERVGNIFGAVVVVVFILTMACIIMAIPQIMQVTK